MTTKPLTFAAALAVCVLAASGCARHTDELKSEPASEIADAPTTAPVAQSATDTMQDAPQNPPRDDVRRVRKVVREFIGEKFPGSEVEGVWVVPIVPNYALAAADTVVNSKHRSIDLVVRQYAREDGTEYWRAERVGSNTDHLRALKEAPLDATPESDQDN